MEEGSAKQVDFTDGPFQEGANIPDPAERLGFWGDIFHFIDGGSGNVQFFPAILAKSNPGTFRVDVEKFQGFTLEIADGFVFEANALVAVAEVETTVQVSSWNITSYSETSYHCLTAVFETCQIKQMALKSLAYPY